MSFLSRPPQFCLWRFLRTVMGTVIVLFCLGFFGLTSPTHGQVAHEIAILKSADIAAYNTAIEAFNQGSFPAGTILAEHNLHGDLNEGRKIGRKIRASNAKLVLAVGLKAALAAKLEIIDIPIVYCMVLNPGKYDLFRPNMDGIDLGTPINQQFDILHHLVPGMRRLGVLFDPSKTTSLIQLARQHAEDEGLQLMAKSVSSEKDVPDALRSLLPTIDSIWLVPDSTVITEDSLEFLLSSALEAKVPVIGFSSGLVRSGALLGLYVKYEDIGNQAAELALSILNGKTIPMGTLHNSTRVSIALNLKVAKYLNIDIPESLTRQADEIF